MYCMYYIYNTYIVLFIMLFFTSQQGALTNWESHAHSFLYTLSTMCWKQKYPKKSLNNKISIL